MVRELIILFSAASIPALAGNVKLLSSLPSGAVSRAIEIDAAGNIYLTGSLTPRNPKDSQDTSDIFVAKVSADGSKVLYFTSLGGSFAEAGAAIAVTSDGSAYVTGSTGSSDFPVTAGAFETTFDLAGASQGFLVKVNPAGAVVYATYINGKTCTTLTGMALGIAGEVFLTGLGGPDFSYSSGQPAQSFILKLDAGLSKVLLSIYGYGGGLMALDSQGNIYLAGNAQPVTGGPVYTLPALPSKAFQSTHTAEICTEGGGPGGSFAQFCTYQFIVKLDPTGKLLWDMYVTGTYGAIPGGMAVDSAGNVIVAGTTNSDDYPVTPRAFQTAYPAAAPQLVPQVGPFNYYMGPPNATGYVTKVNATGTDLIWSTYFGGSFQDQITGMAVSPAGDIVLSGRAGSSDLVLADIPDACRPSANQVLGFVARMSADGASVGATQLVEGVPDCLYLSCSNLSGYQSGWPLALRPDGTAVLAGANGSVASIDFSAGSRIGCLADPADNAQLSSVTPGQLIAIYGVDLGPAIPSVPSGGVAQSTDTFGVFFNGIPAPILYSSAQQINIQVPYEIAVAAPGTVSGSSSPGTVQMRVVSNQIPNPVSETRTLGVADRQPAIFLSQTALTSPYPGLSVCGGATAFGQAALALNEDGTVNDCANPAIAGSKVTVFLNGYGAVTPPLGTGAIAPSPAVALTPSLTPGLFTGTTVVATTSVPGSITGLAQVKLQGGGQSVLLNGAALAGTASRERVIVIWTR
ncbi:exported hypothetical protein [Candidatus Sulfopaludibacter sp. SbA4]|nr:exported hypothetical protein [Candidatus Sulfopaludibacter sp. SbA4]